MWQKRWEFINYSCQWQVSPRWIKNFLLRNVFFLVNRWKSRPPTNLFWFFRPSVFNFLLSPAQHVGFHRNSIHMSVLWQFHAFPTLFSPNLFFSETEIWANCETCSGCFALVISAWKVCFASSSFLFLAFWPAHKWVGVSDYQCRDHSCMLCNKCKRKTAVVWDKLRNVPSCHSTVLKSYTVVFHSLLTLDTAET